MHIFTGIVQERMVAMTHPFTKKQEVMEESEWDREEAANIEVY